MTADPTASAFRLLAAGLPDRRVSKASLNSATGPSHHAGARGHGPNRCPAQSRAAMAAVTTLPNLARPLGTVPQAGPGPNPPRLAQPRPRRGPPDLGPTPAPARHPAA